MSVWGAFIGPLIALAAYTWLDRRNGSRARQDGAERFASFIQSAGDAPRELASDEPVHRQAGTAS